MSQSDQKQKKKINKQNKNRRQRLQAISRIGVMTAVLVVCSQISIPLPGSVPLSLQTFAIALLAWTLTPGQAFYCVLVYLLLGAAGLPVFAGFQGGFARLAGPTGGYLLGFLPMALLLSLAGQILNRRRYPAATSTVGADHPNRQSSSSTAHKPLVRATGIPLVTAASILSLSGLFCCHCIGVLWLGRQAHISLLSAAATGSFPFIIKDIISLVVAALLAGLIHKRFAALREGQQAVLD